jgi:hypothetical protein
MSKIIKITIELLIKLFVKCASHFYNYKNNFPSNSSLSFPRKFCGRNLPVLPIQDLNSGPPHSEPACYQLSYTSTDLIFRSDLHEGILRSRRSLESFKKRVFLLFSERFFIVDCHSILSIRIRIHSITSNTKYYNAERHAKNNNDKLLM